MFKQITDPSADCDLCGAKPSDGRLFMDEKDICLCAECREKLETTPENLRKKLEKVLIGNVM